METVKLLHGVQGHRPGPWHRMWNADGELDGGDSDPEVDDRPASKTRGRRPWSEDEDTALMVGVDDLGESRSDPPALPLPAGVYFPQFWGRGLKGQEGQVTCAAGLLFRWSGSPRPSDGWLN